jgi:hypothetical protein
MRQRNAEVVGHNSKRIVFLDFIHCLVSKEQAKLKIIIDKRYLNKSKYTRPQKIAQGSITNHRATYLATHTHTNP